MSISKSASKIHSSVRKLLREDFKSFLVKAFGILHPDTDFLDNWHLDLLVEYLEAVKRRKVKRLIINIPPRSLKSICISVAWPAWILAINPALRVICSSYSQALSIKHGMDCRNIIQSEWYSENFPNTIISKGNNTKNKITTTKGGFRFSTSVGGTLTGEGADFLIVDDPITPLQAMSSAYRERCNSWFEQTFSSRLNNKKQGAIVIVMQRLHMDDLSGFLLAKNSGWHHLSIPAVAEKEIIHNLGAFDFKREEGHLLHESRDGEEEINRLKSEIGAYAFSSQYQQNPTAVDGGIISANWLYRYEKLPKFESIYQSWDCAIKSGKNNDYTVCTTWGVVGATYYLLNVFRKKLEYPYLKESVISQFDLFAPQSVIIEDKASGQQLIQDLQEMNIVPVVKYLPKKNKLMRLISCSSLFESGNVLIPKNAEWLTEFERELMLFPNGDHDDQVDSATQFLEWIKNNRKRQMQYSIRVL